MVVLFNTGGAVAETVPVIVMVWVVPDVIVAPNQTLLPEVGDILAETKVKPAG